MFRKMMIGATRCALAVLIGLGAIAAATGCDESEYVGYDSGLYDNGGYSSIIGVQADNVDTTLSNFIDYGDGVSWTYEP